MSWNLCTSSLVLSPIIQDDHVSCPYWWFCCFAVATALHKRKARQHKMSDKKQFIVGGEYDKDALVSPPPSKDVQPKQGSSSPAATTSKLPSSDHRPTYQGNHLLRAIVRRNMVAPNSIVSYKGQKAKLIHENDEMVYIEYNSKRYYTPHEFAEAVLGRKTGGKDKYLKEMTIDGKSCEQLAKECEDYDKKIDTENQQLKYEKTQLETELEDTKVKLNHLEQLLSSVMQHLKTQNENQAKQIEKQAKKTQKQAEWIESVVKQLGGLGMREQQEEKK